MDTARQACGVPQRYLEELNLTLRTSRRPCDLNRRTLGEMELLGAVKPKAHATTGRALVDDAEVGRLGRCPPRCQRCVGITRHTAATYHVIASTGRLRPDPGD